MEITLDVKARTETGKGPASRYRAAGLVPAAFYGPSVEPASLLVDAKQMSQALRTEAGGNVLITLEVDGQSRLTVPREVQRHPIRGDILHVDFVNVSRTQKLTALVPVHLVGESHGVKVGGVMEQHLHELQVEAVPTDVPTAIEVDVSGLGIGDGLHVSDLTVPAGVEVHTPQEELLVFVSEPRIQEEDEDVEAVESDETVPVADGAEES